jgi:hypothetical protein
MRVLMTMEFESADREWAAALALCAVGEILSIHGCDEDHRSLLNREVGAWLRSIGIAELKLYGAKKKVQVWAKGNDGTVQSRTFEGSGCQFDPVA